MSNFSENGYQCFNDKVAAHNFIIKSFRDAVKSELSYSKVTDTGIMFYYGSFLIGFIVVEILGKSAGYINQHSTENLLVGYFDNKTAIKDFTKELEKFFKGADSDSAFWSM